MHIINSLVEIGGGNNLPSDTGGKEGAATFCGLPDYWVLCPFGSLYKAIFSMNSVLICSV